MGNEQSRIRNYKKYKITKKEINNNFIRFHLDDYISYSNGNYKHIDFEKKSFFTNFQLLEFSEGRSVLIVSNRDMLVELGGLVFGLAGEINESRVSRLPEQYRYNNQIVQSQTSHNLPPK